MNTGNRTARWVVDLQRRVILECNAAAPELWGYTAAEMIGMGADRLFHPDELGRLSTVRNEHVSGDAGSWRCVRKDGTVFYLRITVQRGVHEGKLCAWAEAVAS